MNREGDKAAAKWQVPLVVAAVALGLGWWAMCWKKESERSACILNLRNVQQSVRAWQGMNSIAPGTPMPALNRDSGLFGPDGMMTSVPICPSGGVYQWAVPTAIFTPGTVFFECSCKGHQPDPAITTDW